MKQLLSLFLFFLAAQSVLAIPARRVPFTAKQPDGTELQLTLQGDEWLHYYTTSDGQPVLVSADGSYCHAMLDMAGYLVKSTHLAHERAARTAGEAAFLSRRGDVSEMLQRARLQHTAHLKKPATRASSSFVPNNYRGTKRALVILAQFADTSFSIPNANAFYEDILNGEGAPQYNMPASLRQYFLDQSEGAFDLTFDIAGPVTVSKKLSYYGANDSKGDDRFASRMIEEAVRLASPLVNYSHYDWDNDGEADLVYVIYAGYAESSDAPEYTIWPHQYTLEGAGLQVPVFNKTRVNQYACGSELASNEGKNPDGIGTILHEMSHVLGLSDIYDTTYGGGSGMGHWDVMDEGCYNGENNFGEVPCNYTAFERWQCGWLEPVELSEGCIIENMNSLSHHGPAYIIYNGAYPDEFYILENRQKTLWDEYVPSQGLLIAHVDYDANAWDSNEVNDDSKHQRYTFVPANNSYTNRKSITYPQPKGNKALTNTTMPAATLFHPNTDGKKLLNKPIEDIKRHADGTISFTFNGGQSDAIALPKANTHSSHTPWTIQGTPARKNQHGIVVINGKKVRQ